MPKPEIRYRVRAVFDERADGSTFGEFENRDVAEECVIVLASRVDIKSATIEEVN